MRIKGSANKEIDQEINPKTNPLRDILGLFFVVEITKFRELGIRNPPQKRRVISWIKNLESIDLSI
ncbi:MAG: hypothetical protein ACTSPQ_19265 [Candidatus Helarchaeota archaeon]